jgi:hypothetical protein
MNDPKARLPRWYLKALYRLLVIGACMPPGSWLEKYQMQAALARMNWFNA